MSKSLRTALDGMIASLRTKEAVKRVSFKIPFVLGKDLSIGIVGCAPFCPAGSRRDSHPHAC